MNAFKTLIFLAIATLFLNGCTSKLHMLNVIWYDGEEGKTTFHEYLKQANPIAAKHGAHLHSELYSSTNDAFDFNPDLLFVVQYPSFGGMFSVLTDDEFEEIFELRTKGAKRKILTSCDVDDSFPTVDGKIAILNMVDLKWNVSYETYRKDYLEPLQIIASQYSGGLRTAIYLPKLSVQGNMAMDADVIFVQSFIDKNAYSAYLDSQELRALENNLVNLIGEKVVQPIKATLL